ncbi:MAG: phage major capsid protein, partial [Clostridia bacterium]|nr:phage major capsid protein [Clostridia bacterium]
MITLTSAENALKTLYLGVVADQLNTAVNPLLARFEKTSSNVWGKEIRKLAPFGINGGIGAGDEDGELPDSASNNYAQFVLTLKNLYGTIEISDKAIRASENNAGAFVNLLEAEMEGLVKASKFNFGRMLFGDGSGILSKIVSQSGNVITVESVRNMMEGMVVDLYHPASGVSIKGRRIIDVDRENKTIKVSGVTIGTNTFTAGDYVTVQGSLNKELTGLGAIFGDSDTLYGLKRADHKWLKPHKFEAEYISDTVIQKAIDAMEEVAGSTADFIVCSAGVKRAYQSYLACSKTITDVMELEGGYKAI